MHITYVALRSCFNISRCNVIHGLAHRLYILVYAFMSYIYYSWRFICDFKYSIYVTTFYMHFNIYYFVRSHMYFDIDHVIASHMYFHVYYFKMFFFTYLHFWPYIYLTVYCLILRHHVLHVLLRIYFMITSCMSRKVATCSSGGATLCFALRSKGEGGQPSYLIIQDVAVHSGYPPTLPQT
jgi:hypothetical protein